MNFRISRFLIIVITFVLTVIITHVVLSEQREVIKKVYEFNNGNTVLIENLIDGSYTLQTDSINHFTIYTIDYYNGRKRYVIGFRNGKAIR